MTTARRVIEQAFSKIEMLTVETPLQASEIEDGLDALNDLIAQWCAMGVLEGVNPVAMADDVVSTSREAILALKANLATILAFENGGEVSRAWDADARMSLTNLIFVVLNSKKRDG